MHTNEKDVFFSKASEASPAPTPQEGQFHVMFVRNNNTHDTKEPQVCDWNHLWLSAKPTSKRDRGLELTQPHFAAQKKTFEHNGQNATKITSALTDTCIQFPGPVKSTLVKTLCLSLVLMTIVSQCVTFLFLPAL